MTGGRGRPPKNGYLQVELMHQLEAEGRTVTDIAKIMGVTRPTVYLALSRELTGEQEAGAREMLEDGASVEEIADRFGVTRDQVRKALGLKPAPNAVAGRAS